MELLRSFPVLLVDDELADDTAAGCTTKALIEAADASPKDPDPEEQAAA